MPIVSKIKVIKNDAKNAYNVVIYGDTDSVYIDFGRILSSMNYPHNKKDMYKVKNFIIYGKEYSNENIYGSGDDEEGNQIGGMSRLEREDLEENAKSIQNFVGNIINKSMENLTIKKCNCNSNKIFFKREAVARSGVFLQRKRYVCWLLNNEGVECNKLKSTGVEIVRSSTPIVVQNSLKSIILNMLKDRDEASTEKEVRTFREKFMSLNPKDIAKPSSVNGFDEWSKKLDEGNGKSCPVHVKSAYFFNKMIESDNKLRNIYEPIRDGDKMKWIYTKTGRDWKRDTLGFKDRWPKEFDLDDYIDYERQFEKVFLKPLEQFYKVFRWDMPNLEVQSMDDLFVW